MIRFLSSTSFFSTNTYRTTPLKNKLLVPFFMSSQGSFAPIPGSPTQEKGQILSDQEKIQAIIAGGRRFIEEAIQNKSDLTHFMASMTLELSKNSQLLRCSQDSLYRAMFACIQLGLEPGPLAHCYFVPRGANVEFHIGYKGLALLASRSKAVSSVSAFCVYENDEFKYIAGTNPSIIHNPILNNRGQLSHVYAIIDLPNGSKILQVMTREDIEKHRECSPAKNFPSSPWKVWPEDMWKKTAVRKALKLIPIDLRAKEDHRAVNSLIYQDVLPLEKENSFYPSLPIVETSLQQQELPLLQEKKRRISAPR